MPVTATLTVTSSADTGLIEASGADVKIKIMRFYLFVSIILIFVVNGRRLPT